MENYSSRMKWGLRRRHTCRSITCSCKLSSAEKRVACWGKKSLINILVLRYHDLHFPYHTLLTSCDLFLYFMLHFLYSELPHFTLSYLVIVRVNSPYLGMRHWSAYLILYHTNLPLPIYVTQLRLCYYQMKQKSNRNPYLYGPICEKYPFNSQAQPLLWI
jgi:hypothetical protein